MSSIKANQLIKKVHIAKRDLGLSDDNYRALLTRVTGQNSCKGLSVRNLNKVIAEFKRLGWQPFKNHQTSNKGYVRKVYGLWRSLCDQGKADNPTRAGLKAFVKRITKIDDPEWLNPEQANKVIEALKAWGARETQKGSIMGVTFSSNDDMAKKVLDRLILMGGKVHDKPSFILDVLASDGVNGNFPIDFNRWLEAKDTDFLHDVCGIMKNINRDTGALDNHFIPRFRKRETQTIT